MAFVHLVVSICFIRLWTTAGSSICTHSWMYIPDIDGTCEQVGTWGFCLSTVLFGINLFVYYAYGSSPIFLSIVFSFHPAVCFGSR